MLGLVLFLEDMQGCPLHNVCFGPAATLHGFTQALHDLKEAPLEPNYVLVVVDAVEGLETPLHLFHRNKLVPGGDLCAIFPISHKI